MDKIPVEIVSIILDYVGYPQLTQCVCRAWREIAGPTARYTIDLMQCAVKDGYLEVLKWGYKQGCYIPQNIWCWCVMLIGGGSSLPNEPTVGCLLTCVLTY